MSTYRTFCNADPPIVVDLWRSRAAEPGLAQPVSVDLFEQSVFGKLYFDPEGMILGFDGDRPAGFAHAAFGPNAARDGVDCRQGVICLVVVRPDAREDEFARGLLERCEAYLRGRGAAVLFGGAAPPRDPFYLGLYGRSEPPGVLACDELGQRLFPSHGYSQTDRTLMFRCLLDRFRVPVDRRHVQLRRRTSVEMKPDPPARSWWEASITAEFDLTRFQVTERGKGAVLASATFRGMQPTNDAENGRAVGMLDVEVDPGHRGRGLASFLVSESFRQLARQGVTVVETQTRRSNPGGVALCHKLGMSQVAEGSVFRKELG
jgi:ribosomal protein S18 acetylase RimI-like enzyme